MLISTLPNSEFGILKKLRNFFPENCFIEVEDLDDSTGEEILRTFFRNDNRQLTLLQHDLIMNGFQSCRSPLFLKVGQFLLFTEWGWIETALVTQ